MKSQEPEEYRDRATNALRGRRKKPAAEYAVPVGANLTDQVVGAYRLIKPLGEGGMGAVFEAVHLRAGYTAAVKILHPDVSMDPQARTRFLREAQVAKRVRHPGIVEIYDVGERDDGLLYIVMERLYGEPLSTRLRADNEALGLSAVPLLMQIAAALAAAHGQGVVHRDLKPENIMIIPDPERPGQERIKLLDFGIAQIPTDTGAHRLTGPQVILGTPAYMSPEQCRGQEVDHRSDIYSLGVLSYQLLSGRLPFQSLPGSELIVRQCTEPPPPIEQIVPMLPSTIVALVHRMLAKERSTRPALSDVCAQLAASLGEMPKASAPPRVGLRASNYAVGGIALFGLISLLFSGWMAGRPTVTTLRGEADGSWIYSLHDKHSGARVYGAFQVESSAAGLSIPRGRVWYVGDQPEPHVLRGIWRSKAATLSGQTLHIIFQMESTTEHKEAGQARWYDGVLELTRTGGDKWVGTYHDLGSRHEHWGTLSAERDPASSLEEAAVSAYRRFGSP